MWWGAWPEACGMMADATSSIGRWPAVKSRRRGRNGESDCPHVGGLESADGTPWCVMAVEREEKPWLSSLGAR